MFICESSFGHYVGFRPCSEAVYLSSSVFPIDGNPPGDTLSFGLKGYVALNRVLHGFQGISGLTLPKLLLNAPPPPPLPPTPE